MILRLGKVTVADVLAAQPVTTNLLKFMRASIKMIGVSFLQSSVASKIYTFPYTTLFRSRSTAAVKVAGMPTASIEVSTPRPSVIAMRSEEHTSELQSRPHLVCRLLLE